MSRPVVILVALVVLVVAILIGLASVDTKRTPTRVEKDMLNAPQPR